MHQRHKDDKVRGVCFSFIKQKEYFLFCYITNDIISKGNISLAFFAFLRRTTTAEAEVFKYIVQRVLL